MAHRFQVQIDRIRTVGLEEMVHRLATQWAGFATGEWEAPTSAAIESEAVALRRQIDELARLIASYDIGDSGPYECHEVEALAGILGDLCPS
jgi:hypothetical protein